MRYLDYLFACTILVTSLVFILVIEICHLRGAILDIPFLWMIIAILNFLRLRHVRNNVRGLRVFCIGANLIALTLEVVRLRLFGRAILKNWGPYTVIVAVAVLGEVIFSVIQKNGSASPAQL